jgi:hypothetical protein
MNLVRQLVDNWKNAEFPRVSNHHVGNWIYQIVHGKKILTKGPIRAFRNDIDFHTS